MIKIDVLEEKYELDLFKLIWSDKFKTPKIHCDFIDSFYGNALYITLIISQIIILKNWIYGL